jgi:hypothetical protein
MLYRRPIILLLLFFSVNACRLPKEETDNVWKIHSIDNTLLGADGIRFGKETHNTLPNLVTGWEQSGLTRIYFPALTDTVSDTWQYVTVGISPNVEDAILVDIDGDGFEDVISASEGNSMQLNIHWAPSNKENYQDSTKWITEIIPTSKDVMQWMFLYPQQLDGKFGTDFIAGGKRDREEFPKAAIGWFQAPENPKKLDQWKWIPLAEVNWVMSIDVVDINQDGYPDIVYSERKGDQPGVKWLEHPKDLSQPWTLHTLGDQGTTVLFMTRDDLDEDGLEDIIVIKEKDGVKFIQKQSADGSAWKTHTIAFPERVGSRGKAVTVADLNNDGKKDIILSFEQAGEQKSGVIYLTYTHTVFDSTWNRHEVSGDLGIKFDLIPVLDMDNDGDLDILTTEENNNAKNGNAGLGLIWYENPTLKK